MNVLRKLFGLNTRGRGSQRFVPTQGPPKSGMEEEAVRKKMADVPFWWHHIELGYGIVTPGRSGKGRPWTCQAKQQWLNLPEDLTGKSVLDIGAWDGFYSFEMEKRNAARVLAVDNFARYINTDGTMNKEKNRRLGAKGFFVAKEILASEVEFKEIDVYDLSPETVGVFDIVLFLGVIYHLRHPLLALERVASVTREMMVLESYCVKKLGKAPAACFYEGDELSGDMNSWWGPNRACLEALARSAGFRRTEHVKTSGPRVVIHAYK